MYKKTIRKDMLKIRNAFSEQEITQKSAVMWEILMQTDVYQKADIIFENRNADAGSKIRGPPDL